MPICLGFDGTDDRDAPFGTGKLARRFQAALPEGCVCLGDVRQQLLVTNKGQLLMGWPLFVVRLTLQGEAMGRPSAFQAAMPPFR